VAKCMSAKVEPRDVAAEIIRRARTTASRDGESLPYVVRFSDPPTANEQLQLAACKILGHRVAIMPAKCLTVQEWCERYARPDRR
jgi:hypothetical protein